LTSAFKQGWKAREQHTVPSLIDAYMAVFDIFRYSQFGLNPNFALACQIRWMSKNEE